MNEIAQSNELIHVLQNSLYPGATDKSCLMVIQYCKAAKLDVMQKPVHIVPLSVKDPITGKYGYRDVIMPGIGLYRIQAERSGSYAGSSEPSYGEIVNTSFIDKNGNKLNQQYPEWCRITVKKIVDGVVCEFTAKEYWLENYATDSGKSSAPNKMWSKRPMGQLSKCTESQALRRAWPELCCQPTAEEMEGKGFIEESIEEKVIEEVTPYPEIKFDRNLETWMEMITSGKYELDELVSFVNAKGYPLTDSQVNKMRDELGEMKSTHENT